MTSLPDDVSTTNPSRRLESVRPTSISGRLRPFPRSVARAPSAIQPGIVSTHRSTTRRRRAARRASCSDGAASGPRLHSMISGVSRRDVARADADRRADLQRGHGRPLARPGVSRARLSRSPSLAWRCTGWHARGPESASSCHRQEGALAVIASQAPARCPQGRDPPLKNAPPTSPEIDGRLCAHT